MCNIFFFSSLNQESPEPPEANLNQLQITEYPNKKEILQELDILQAVKGNKNVIGFYGAFYHPASVKMPEREGLWISMERWFGVTVQDLIKTRRSLSEDWIAYICREVLQGLSHLHKQKVIHHDLKPLNIIVTSSADVKINNSATLETSSVSTSGTIPYMAPEVLSNISTKTVRYNSKADIWSLGISALEMAEGYYRKSDNFRAFISKILQKNPAWRPSAEQLLLHPFISNISNERGTISIYCSYSYNILCLSYIYYNSLTKAAHNKG
ncbi:hypothetical protein XELAEV_18001202mg [Xenopus laevis]|nr:hypothetical protein XELAEV_18001202mg [Xenopus laevis]